MVSSQVGFLKKVLILLGFSVTFVTKPVTAELLKDFSTDISANNFYKNLKFTQRFKKLYEKNIGGSVIFGSRRFFICFSFSARIFRRA